MGLDKFSTALDLLKGFDVNLFVGEDVFKGKLIGVEPDHVVLLTENKSIFYYNIDKIQAITKNTRSFQPDKTTAKFQKTQSLKDLLHSFQNSWVTILSINKQRFTGVLSDIDSDFATLINGEERILIKLTHVSNIHKGFIKEETVKSSSSKDNDDKNKDSDNKKDSKEQSSSSSKKDDSGKDDTKKNEKSKSGSKEDSKKDEKSKSGSKEDSNSSDKHHKSEKSDKKQEAAIKEDYAEPNNTMVWSQPIKIESTMIQTKDDVSSNFFKIKKSNTEEKDTSKNNTEMKKTIEDMSSKDKKSEEAKSSNAKESEQPKEKKQVKEAATIQTDNKPAPPLSFQQKEVTQTKTQETAKATKPATSSQNQEPKKAEKTTNDVNTNNNVWKQKEQETKVLRFSGEPVTSDSQRAFPFAGWPNRNNRTARI